MEGNEVLACDLISNFLVNNTRNGLQLLNDKDLKAYAAKYENFRYTIWVPSFLELNNYIIPLMRMLMYNIHIKKHSTEIDIWSNNPLRFRTYITYPEYLILSTQLSIFPDSQSSYKLKQMLLKRFFGTFHEIFSDNMFGYFHDYNNAHRYRISLILSKNYKLNHEWNTNKTININTNFIPDFLNHPNDYRPDYPFFIYELSNDNFIFSVNKDEKADIFEPSIRIGSIDRKRNNSLVPLNFNMNEATNSFIPKDTEIPITVKNYYFERDLCNLIYKTINDACHCAGFDGISAFNDFSLHRNLGLPNSIMTALIDVIDKTKITDTATIRNLMQTFSKSFVHFFPPEEIQDLWVETPSQSPASRSSPISQLVELNLIPSNQHVPISFPQVNMQPSSLPVPIPLPQVNLQPSSLPLPIPLPPAPLELNIQEDNELHNNNMPALDVSVIQEEAFNHSFSNIFGPDNLLGKNLILGEINAFKEIPASGDLFSSDEILSINSQNLNRMLPLTQKKYSNSKILKLDAIKLATNDKRINELKPIETESQAINRLIIEDTSKKALDLNKRLLALTDKQLNALNLSNIDPFTFLTTNSIETQKIWFTNYFNQKTNLISSNLINKYQPQPKLKKYIPIKQNNRVLNKPDYEIYNLEE